MASRLLKSRQRIVVSSVVVFILLNVSSSSSASKPRCYWCGPLAEQVHRSQRAPPCTTFHLEPHETECDPGYSHCAIVATSPPYAESRLCVKFYQDECYSLYCNSTKTWRMVCACQGDLCNGPHTERENEAFALVPKFAKNKSRNKRSAANFIGVKTKNAAEENTIIIMSKEPNDTETLNDQPTADKPGEHATSPTDDEIKVQITPTPRKAEDNYMIVHGSLTTVEKNDVMKTDNSEVSKKDVEPTMPNMKDKNQDTTKMDMNIETTKMDTPMVSNTNKVNDNPHDNPKMNSTSVEKDHGDDKINNHTNTDNNKGAVEINKPSTQMDQPLDTTTKPPESKETTVTSTRKTTLDMSVEVQTSVAPGKMPPAENLQQNTTPTKAMEITTMGTVVTESHIVETTTSSGNNDTQKKNGGKQNLAHAVVLVTCMFAKYCV